jgi:hypothetical protein
MIKKKNQFATVFMIFGGIILAISIYLFFLLVTLINRNSGTAGFTIFEIFELFPLAHLVIYSLITGLIIITIGIHLNYLSEIDYSNRLLLESNNKLLDSNILILQELIKSSLKEKEQS